MDISLKEEFIRHWRNYFGDAELPIIFFYTDGDGGADRAAPDIPSGLFTLSNFDGIESDGTFTPFGAGCGTIIHYPNLESLNERQRAVIGMFDPSARPCIKENELSFALPMKRFIKMISYMEESFLITDTWSALKKRIDE